MGYIGVIVLAWVSPFVFIFLLTAITGIGKFVWTETIETLQDILALGNHLKLKYIG